MHTHEQSPTFPPTTTAITDTVFGEWQTTHHHGLLLTYHAYPEVM